MNNKVKKPLLFLVCLSATFATLAGCGKKKKATNTIAPTTETTTTVAPTTDNNNSVTPVVSGPKVYFIVDGEVIKEVPYNEDTASVKEPDIPEKAGYTSSWMNYNLTGKDVYVTAVYLKLNTKYTIEYYLQNLENDDYTIVSEDTQEFDSTVNSNIKPFIKNYEGFSCINADAGLTLVQDQTKNVLKVYYDRDIFNVKINYDNAKENKDINVKYGTVLNEANPEKAGYDFINWTDKYNEEYDMSLEVTKPLELKANFNAKTNIKYTVKYYTENLDGEYVEEESERLNLTGKVDTTASVTLDENKYTGYEIDMDKTVSSGNINGDESLVLEIYYKCKRFNVTYKYADGVTEDYVAEIKYGQKATNIAVNRDGYAFAGWVTANSSNFNFNTEIYNDVTLFASYVAETGKSYTVNYYIYKPELEDYDLADTLIDSGSTGQEITADLKSNIYYGYDINEEKSNLSGNILADGSLVLNVYYDRKTYTFNFIDNNKVVNVVTAKFNESFDIEEVVEKIGYTWNSLSFNKAVDHQDIGHVVTLNYSSQLSGIFDILYDNYSVSEYNIYVGYTTRNDIEYKVKVYYENIVDDEFTYSHTLELTGETNSVIDLDDIAHFTFFTARGETEDDGLIIKADGSTVIRAYYKREKYTVGFVTDSEDVTSINEISNVKYGTILEAPDVYRTGYTFAGWEDQDNDSFDFSTKEIDKNYVLTAIWESNTNTKFKIVHHYEKVDSDEYDDVEVESEGTTNSTISISPLKQVQTGFYYDDYSYNYSYIERNGLTVVNIYYKRSKYNVYFSLNSANEQINTMENVKYGTIIGNIELTKYGYTFAGWKDDEDNVFRINSDIVNRSMHLYAQWTPNTNTKYIVRHNYENIDDDKYTTIEEEYFGTTDEQINQDANYYLADYNPDIFTFDEAHGFGYTSSVIKGNPENPTIIDIYYNRLSYRVDVYVDSHIELEGNYSSYEYKYGKEINLKAIFDNYLGYEYIGMYSDSDANDLITIEDEYNFTVTQNREIYIITKVIDEMNDFNFESTEDTLVINGLKEGSDITDLVIPDIVTGIGYRAFYGNETIRTITFGKNFKYIGDEAFANCNIDSVVFDSQSNIDFIGVSAFANSTIGEIIFCDNIKEIRNNAFNEVKIHTIELPKNLEIIGQSAFSSKWDNYSTTNYFHIDTLIIPNTVKEIGDNAFINTLINNVVFEENSSIEHIGAAAFSCTGLLNLTLPDNIEEIDEYSFSNSCYGTIFIPKKIKKIKEGAFQSCSATSIIFEEGSLLEEIEKYAFGYNDKLNGLLTLPDNLEIIGMEAFYACSFSSIILNENLTTIGTNAFGDTSNLSKIYNKSSLILEAGSSLYGSIAANITDPSNIIQSTSTSNIVIDGNYVYLVEIEDSVEVNRTLLSYTGDEIVINGINPKTTIIGENAFAGKIIYDVVIPDQVIEIKNNAFYNCTYLSRLTLGPNVSIIDDNAFGNCPRLVEIYNRSDLVLESGTNGYGKVARYARYITKSNTYQANVSLIDDKYIVWEYENEVYLIGVYIDNLEKEFTVPDCVTVIYNDLLNNNNSIEKINLANSNVKVIMHDAFYRAQRVTYISLPDTLVKIEDGAFSYVGESYTLTYFNINDCTNLTHIGDGAFYKLRYYGDIVLPNSLVELKSNAFAFSYMKSVAIGSNLTQITHSAFSNCYRLENIIFYGENNIEEIGGEAFANCYKLRSIELGENLTFIDALAFNGCYRLHEIINKANPSNIEIEMNSEENGYVAYYALVIYNDELPSSIVYDNDFIYYIDGDDKVLINYIGESKNVVIPNDVTKIGAYTFYDMNDILVSFEENSAITEVGEGAFYYCNGCILDLNDMPNLTTIGKQAFYGCIFDKLFISKKVVSLGKEAFRDASCEVLVIDPETTLTTIPASVFVSTSYNAFVIPANITEIGDDNNPGYGGAYIYYMGTSEEFALIAIANTDYSNETLLATPRCYYSETEPEAEDLAYYWRFTDDYYPLTWEAYIAKTKFDRMMELMKYHLNEAFNNDDYIYRANSEYSGIAPYNDGIIIRDNILKNILEAEESIDANIFEGYYGNIALGYNGTTYHAYYFGASSIDGLSINTNNDDTGFYLRLFK